MRRGFDAFNSFYKDRFADAWPAILASLGDEETKIQISDNIKYKLDPASICVAKAIDLEIGQSFLDLCAAPGGKSLVVINEVGGQAQFYLNELSKNRIHRLRRVLKESLNPEILKNVKTFNRDGSRWGIYEKDMYDRVLLDAPCSGERHLLQTKKELDSWTPKRIKNLSMRQYALLCSAGMAVKPGGKIVYSTCALLPDENDLVVEKFLKKKIHFRSVPTHIDLGYITQHGRQIRPDHHAGFGPMYFSVIEKLECANG